MISAVLPRNESERLAELYSFNILDSAPEEDFTDIVELASYICDTPVSLISLIDANRQWFKAKKGFAQREMPRTIAFCAHTIVEDGPLIVRDALEDKRFANNPLVLGKESIRFYAGFPLTTQSGYKLGSLCVIDQKPRTLNVFQLQALRILSEQVIKLIEEKTKTELLQEAGALEKKHNNGLLQLIDTQRKIMSILGHDTRAPLHAINRLIRQAAAGQISTHDMLPYFDLIGNQLDATLILLDNLVSWGKAHVSPGAIPASGFAVHDVADEAVELLSATAMEKGIDIQNRISPAIMMFSSRQIVAFTIRNLISNAIKFSKGGSVVIEAAPQPGFIAISVADSGVGMTEEQLRAYKQGELHSLPGTAQETGSGLGVSLILEFLQQHGGQLLVNSQPGKGTTVTVHFRNNKPIVES